MIKYLLSPCLIVLNFNLSANELENSESLILRSYSESLAELENSEEQCEKQATVLPKNLFSGINLSKKEMEAVLLYKQHETFIHCTMAERYKYFMSASLLRAKKPKSAKMVDASNNINSYYFLRLLETEVEYKKIEQSKRDKIDKLEPLKSPFDLMSSLDVIVNEP
ncbi:hypothetical protein DXX93_07575 [Thalassotalea euphylliae]|uniref:Uncharacterized protein n=1 Tax=Thalassotalea euphylliae TaxID=1655234 RepID=A0A3E0TPK4_9GAMM|nr:hypothetical protein [Thalassotalea euphylliae]REL26454.1 hypothetical protein DXX93_07575 [Thalassotalea euphylliae]